MSIFNGNKKKTGKPKKEKWNWNSVKSFPLMLKRHGDGTVVYNDLDIPGYSSLKSLKIIGLKSPLVRAITDRTIEDALRCDIEIVPKVANPSDSQKALIKNFMKYPNPYDIGNSWMETVIFDMRLLNLAYIMIEGDNDKVIITKDKKRVETFGGTLKYVYDIDASKVTELFDGRYPLESPEPSYKVVENGIVKYYTSTKIIRIASGEMGMDKPYPRLRTTLNLLLDYQLLENYTGNVFKGNIPKTLLNFGKVPEKIMERLVKNIHQQMENSENAYGLVALNGPDLQKERLTDDPSNGEYIKLLQWYREMICAVFGIPPMKLGIVETGKLSNPEQQLDTWYDVIEGVQNKISFLFNQIIFPKMGITDWDIRFVSPRPRNMDVLAKTFFEFTQGLAMLGNNSVLSTNEERRIISMIFNQEYKLPDFTEDWASDPTYIAPGNSIYMKEVIMPKIASNEPGTPTESNDDSDVVDNGIDGGNE